VPSFVPNSSKWWSWHAVRSDGDFKACRPWSVRAGPRTCFFCRDCPCSIASSSLANPLALDRPQGGTLCAIYSTCLLLKRNA
jgi:hypothetical protein